MPLNARPAKHYNGKLKLIEGFSGSWRLLSNTPLNIPDSHPRNHSLLYLLFAERQSHLVKSDLHTGLRNGHFPPRLSSGLESCLKSDRMDHW